MQSPKHTLAIARFFRQHKRLPSYREMLTLTGFKSTNAVYRLVGRLVELGFLSKDKNSKFAPGPHLLGVSVLGTVEAGWPSPAEEELVDTLTLDDWLIHNREATFMLKVSGDSMIEAGIRPGDMLLVERGRTPRSGDIIVAEVDKHWTLKYYERHGGRVVLMPANKKYKPILPQEELNIAAVVTAVIRKYHS